MSKQGVMLGRGGAPSFRAVLPGIPIVRRAAGQYITGLGTGLYGSASMVRAIIVTGLPPYFVTFASVWRQRDTGTNTGWLILAAGSSSTYTFSFFDTVGTAHPLSAAASDWPNLTIFVETYDGVFHRLYKNGTLVQFGAVANIAPAPATITEDVLAGTTSSWVAHFFGSDGAGAFLNDAGVLAWSKAAAAALKMRQNITPWAGCERWWNAADIGRITWTDRIGAVTATATVPGTSTTLLYKSLPTSSAPRII